MKYSANQVIQGIIDYADNEVMNKLPMKGKWVVGTTIGVASKKAENIIDSLKSNTFVNMLGIMEEDGSIDVDELIEALRSTADKYGNLSIDVPLVGRLSFSASDVESLRRYIR